MIGFTLTICGILFIASFFHKSLSLAYACVISAGVYFLYWVLDSVTSEYVYDYVMYLALDLIWLGAVLSIAAPNFTRLLVLCNVAVNALSLAFPNHWLIYGHQAAIYVILQTLVAASLTILPLWKPLLFGIKNDNGNNRPSFFAFVPVYKVFQRVGVRRL